MPKSRKRKTPIASQASHTPSIEAQSCRNIIRKFHVLLKQRRQVEDSRSLVVGHEGALANIEREIEELGGLETYQRMSVLGQRNERGGGSEKIFIGWMKELRLHKKSENHGKLRLLEVGALMPDNYLSCSKWIDNTPTDLHSRHPQIIEQDFLQINAEKNTAIWDAISLSLVLNFVPIPEDRGCMLTLAHQLLREDGLLFLALPLPCVSNSRYLTFDHLKSLMESIGFSQIRERWQKGGKMGYWLYQKRKGLSSTSQHPLDRKVVLRQGDRNNFAIMVKR